MLIQFNKISMPAIYFHLVNLTLLFVWTKAAKIKYREPFVSFLWGKSGFKHGCRVLKTWLINVLEAGNVEKIGESVFFSKKNRHKSICPTKN